MSERRRRIGVALLVSVALHGAILVGLGWVEDVEPPRIERVERPEPLSIQVVTVPSVAPQAPQPEPASQRESAPQFEPAPQREPGLKHESKPQPKSLPRVEVTPEPESDEEPGPPPDSSAVARAAPLVATGSPETDGPKEPPPAEPEPQAEEPPFGPREGLSPGLRAGLLPRTGLFAPGGPEVSPRDDGSGVKVTNPWESGIRTGERKSPQRALAELLGESKVRARNVHSYFVTLGDALLAQWEGEARRGPQAPNRPERCVVKMVQGPDGRLRELELLRRSGNRDMDTLVLRNLLMAELPEPPPEVVEGREHIETHWEFELLAHEIRASQTFDLVTLFDPNAIPPPSDKRVRLVSVL